MRWLVLWAGAIGALVMSAPAVAKAPDHQDVTAARRLIAAETRFDRAFLAHRAAITRAGKGYAAMVKARCAGALPEQVALHGTRRQRRVVKDLFEEAALGLYAADTRSIRGVERRFLRALNHVNFTQLSLTIAVGSIAEGSAPLTRMIDLCADVKSAAASDFAADPPGTARAVRLGREMSAGQEPYVPRRITPYLITPADRTAAKTARTLNTRSDNFTDDLILNETPPVLDALIGSNALAGIPLDRPSPGLDR